MKKLFLSLVVCLLLASVTNAQNIPSNKGDKINVSALRLEPWQVVGTTNKAESNTQNIYQMGNVGINTNSPAAALDVWGNARIRGLVDGNVLADYPRTLVVNLDGKLATARSQFIKKTVIVPAGTAFTASSTEFSNEIVAASGNFTSDRGGLLRVLGDGQMSVNNATVTVGFSFWVDGVRADQVLQYFPSAAKLSFVFNFNIPDISAGNHTWQLRYNGNSGDLNFSYVNPDHKYQLTMFEVGN